MNYIIENSEQMELRVINTRYLLHVVTIMITSSPLNQ